MFCNPSSYIRSDCDVFAKLDNALSVNDDFILRMFSKHSRAVAGVNTFSLSNYVR